MTLHRALRFARAAVPACLAGVLSAPVAAAPPDGFPRTLVDDDGHALTLATPARRVVTTAPNLTEIVADLGALDRLVGTVDTSNHPAAARAVPRIGDHQRLDLERLIALKPDLVLVWTHGGTERELDALRRAGLALFKVEPMRLAEVPPAIERVGRLLGLDAAGRRRAAALRGELDALRAARPAAAAPVDVFYQVWSEPLMTINDRQLIADVIALCGGRNVFGSLAPLVPQVSTEAVLRARPEAILAAREDGSGGPAAQRAPRDRGFAAWQRFADFTPVRRGWLYTLPGDEITRAGPRLAHGARAMCGALDEVRRERAARP
jgi:iron complex transport system substrate-binding protein